jgi:hypothetical protein
MSGILPELAEAHRQIEALGALVRELNEMALRNRAALEAAMKPCPTPASR